MPARIRRSGRLLALAAALVVAACSDSTGPQGHLSDPQGLSSDLQSVGRVLTSPTFQSFTWLSSAPGTPVPAPSRAGALLGAAPIAPPRSAARPYADPARLQALRRTAAAFRTGISAAVIPSPLLGKTFVWDPGTHQYVEDPTATPAAPANGVRIILYAVDPLTGAVVENPLTQVGYVDLLDESTTAPAVDRLHVVVSGGTPAAPGTAHADYTVSATVTGSPPTAFTATADGFVSDGTHTLTFSATFAATNLDTDNPDIQIDVTWDLDNPAVHVELHETLATPNADQLNLTILLTITRGTETISVHGTVSVNFVTGSASVNLVIDVNALPWAVIRGTDNGITARHPDGSTLSAQELQALSDLFGLPDQLEQAILGLFTPCQSLMGA
jgi:hypothetical protein